jgi:hypothetical protein
MIHNSNNPLNNKNGSAAGGTWSNSENDLITELLYQIIRVKDLIKHYEAMPGDNGILAASILNELVSEAHRSLVDYDTVLMKKYYDLLLNCD